MAEGGAGTVSDDTPVAKAKSGSPNVLESPEDRKLAYHKLDGVLPGVVYIHGLCSDMEGVKALALEDYCRSQGRAFVRFDLSGHGQSSEKFTECNMTTWLEDLTSVLNSLTDGPQVLIGNSIGAWLMFLYSMRNPEKVHALIGISSAPDFTQQLWKRLAKEDKQELKRTGLYKMPSAYMPDPIQVTMQLIQDGDRYNILDMPGIEYIKVPVWLFHGEQDDVTPSSVALKLMQRLQCPVSLKTVQEGDHRLARPQDIKVVLEALTELFNPEESSAASEQED